MHTLKSAIIPLLISSIILTTNALLAEDFKTIDGKEYKNVTVSRVEADGIVLTSSSGISKVYFTELPKEVQGTFSLRCSEGCRVLRGAECETRAAPKAE